MRVSRYEELYERIGNCPYGTCVFPGTSIPIDSRGFDSQAFEPSVLTSIKCESLVTKNYTNALEIVRTELARFPVRALTAMFAVCFLLNID